MTVKEIPVNIRCLEYRQDEGEYARFYFNLEKYELIIISDCGNYAYQWIPTPEYESFFDLMTRINSDYLLWKVLGRPKEFDYEATKERFYQCNAEHKKRLDEIFEKIESRFIPDNGETFIKMFERENDGWWRDVWEYPVYDYTLSQKRIARIFQENIQPVIKDIVEAESEGV